MRNSSTKLGLGILFLGFALFVVVGFSFTRKGMTLSVSESLKHGISFFQSSRQYIGNNTVNDYGHSLTKPPLPPKAFQENPIAAGQLQEDSPPVVTSPRLSAEYLKLVDRFEPIHCGSGWQERFALLYNRPQEDLERIIISVSFQSGLADRLTGLISQILLGVVTNTPVFIAGIRKIPDIKQLFVPVTANWLKEGPISDLVERITTMSSNNCRLCPMTLPDMNGIRVSSDLRQFHIYDILNTVPPESFEPLHSLVAAKGVTLARSNRGLIHRLFTPHYHDQLKELNLTMHKEHAFGCIFRSFFHIHPRVSKIVEPLMNIMSRPNVITIGIHIRVGDDAMKEPGHDHSSAAEYHRFFDCAWTVEQELVSYNTAHGGSNNTEVVWLLLSDSVALRQSAKNQFGQKVVTVTQAAVAHQDCATHGSSASSCESEALTTSGLEAVADMTLLSTCHVQIVTYGSGYGKLSTQIAAGMQPVFVVDKVDLQFGSSCQIEDRTPWNFMATTSAML